MHRVQRRVVNSVYTIATLKELEPDIDRTIAHFMDIMRQKEGQVLDWGLWVQLFAFGKHPTTLPHPTHHLVRFALSVNLLSL